MRGEGVEWGRSRGRVAPGAQHRDTAQETRAAGGREREPGQQAGALRLAGTRAPSPTAPGLSPSSLGLQGEGVAGLGAREGCHQSSTSQLRAFLGQAGPGRADLQMPL